MVTEAENIPTPLGPLSKVLEEPGKYHSAFAAINQRLIPPDQKVRVRAGAVVVGSGAHDLVKSGQLDSQLNANHLDASQMTFADAQAACVTVNGEKKASPWGPEITDLFFKTTTDNNNTTQTVVSTRAYQGGGTTGVGPGLWLLFLPPDKRTGEKHVGFVLEKPNGTAELCIHSNDGWRAIAFDAETDDKILTAFEKAGQLADSGRAAMAADTVDAQDTTDRILLVRISMTLQYPDDWVGRNSVPIHVIVHHPNVDTERRIVVGANCPIFGLITMIYDHRHFKYLNISHIQTTSKMNLCTGTLSEHTVGDGAHLFVVEKWVSRSSSTRGRTLERCTKKKKSDADLGIRLERCMVKPTPTITPGAARPGDVVRPLTPREEKDLFTDPRGVRLVPNFSVTPVVYEENFVVVKKGAHKESDWHRAGGCLAAIGKTQRHIKKVYPLTIDARHYLSNELPVQELTKETLLACIQSACGHAAKMPECADTFGFTIKLHGKPQPPWLKTISNEQEEQETIKVTDVIEPTEDMPEWMSKMTFKIDK